MNDHFHPPDGRPGGRAAGRDLLSRQRHHHRDRARALRPSRGDLGADFGPGFGRGFDRGFGGQHGMGGPIRRGRRAGIRRGDVRSAILTLLAEAPMHGYQVMQLLAERSGGIWQPSAGSIYPTLQQLEDEGLVTSAEQDGRRVFSLTDAGRTAAAEQAKRGAAPWQVPGADEAADARSLVFGLMVAFRQAAASDSPATVTAARKIVADARRDLYRLLADEDSGPPPADD